MSVCRSVLSLLLVAAAFVCRGADPVTRYWIGGASGDFRTAANWSRSGTPANTDTCIFTNNVSVNLDRPTSTASSKSSYAYIHHKADGCTVTFSSTNSVGELQLWQPYDLDFLNGGKWVFSNVELSNRGTINWNFSADSYSFAPASTNILHTSSGYTCKFAGDLDNNAFIEVRDGGAYQFTGGTTNYTGRLTAPTAMTNSLGLAANMVVWGVTSNTVTYVNALRYPTISVMLPTVPHATLNSVLVNGLERLQNDDSYTLYEGSTLEAFYTAEAGYTISTNRLVAANLTASCVIADDLLPVATAIEIPPELEGWTVWSGAGGDARWENPTNWLYGGVRAVTNAPGPADRVLFTTTNAVVTLASQATVTNLLVNAPVTFSGARIQTGLVSGDATITLGDDAGFSPYNCAYAKITISNDLEIAGENVSFACYGSNAKNGTWGTTMELLGDLSGRGSFSTSGIRSAVIFSGTNTAFSGIAMFKTDNLPRHDVQLAAGCASSSNAVWKVEENANKQSMLTQAYDTYYFGSLSGTVNQKNTYNEGKAVTLEIGARADVPSVLGGSYSRQSDRISGEGAYIRKIGSGLLDFSGYWTQGFEVNGGTFRVASSNNFPLSYISFKLPGGTLLVGDGSDPSALIKNSNAPIAIDVGDSNVTWSTGLSANNTVAEIVKKGAGTLTIAAALPWETVKITAEEGSVTVPKDTVVTLGTRTLATTNDTGTITLTPDDAVEDGAYATHTLNRGWEYLKADGYPLSAAWASTNDASWTACALPHSLNAADTFNHRASDAGVPGWRGIAFYKKTLVVSEGEATRPVDRVYVEEDNKVILEFETVRQAIYLWVNGAKVGYYEGGIASSAFDITDYLTDGTNEIFVALDSTSGRGMTTYLAETVPGTEWNSRTGSGYQWNVNDFNPTEGGLTGSVRLHVKPKTYLTLPLYNNLKTSGTYVTASDFDFANSNATITVQAEVRNESGVVRSLAIGVEISDAATGDVVGAFTNAAVTVGSVSDAGTNFMTAVEDDVYCYDADANTWYGATNATTRLASGVETTVLTASNRISNLVFWSPDTPHLYTVKVALLDAGRSVIGPYLLADDTTGTSDLVGADHRAARVVDEETITTGFREVAYDKESGLTINGKYFWLTGYAQRATDEWAAVGIPPDWLYDYDAALMRESGANFIRWMHIAPKPKMQRALDKFGLVAVVPAGDKEGDPGDGRAWTQRQEAMRDVILAFRNSPAAVFWEAGNNELTEVHMARMTEIRRTLDRDGSRMMGCRTLQQAATVTNAEWVGTMLNRHADKAYAAMQATGHYVPILELEYAREESPRRTWDDYTGPDYDYIDHWLGSGADDKDGYDTYDYNLEDFTRVNFDETGGYAYFYGNRVGGIRNPYYSGCAALCWSDSIQHGRNCWAENARMSGRVDPVRLPKTTNFRAYQVAQATVPKVAILGHWSYEALTEGNYRYPLRESDGTYYACTGEYAQRDPTKKTVYVVGSVHCAKVELYVNGALKGTCTEPERIFLFPFPGIDVTESGTVTAKAYDAAGNVIAEDSLVSAGAPDHLAVTVTTGPDGWRADGGDLAMIDVRLVDAKGTLVPAATNRLEFSLSSTSTSDLGPLFLGGYNSGTYTTSSGENGPCGVSPIGENWVNLEAGENRVFVRAGDAAGDATLAIACPDFGYATNLVLTATAARATVAPQTLAANAADYTATTTCAAVNDLGTSDTSGSGTYYWTDSTGDHDPAKAANWSTSGVYDNLPPSYAPGTNATLIVNRDAVFTTSASFGFATLRGTGTLTLSNATIRSFEPMTIDCDLEMATASTNALMIGARGASIAFSGALKGTGKLKITQWTGAGTNADTGLKSTGDWSSFAGSVDCALGSGSSRGVVNYQQRSYDTFLPASSSALARWNVYAEPDHGYNRSSGSLFATEGAYRYGALKLRLPTLKSASGCTSGVTLDTGYFDEPGFVRGSWYRATGCGVVWRAESAAFTNEAANTAFITNTASGTIVIMTNAMPTAALVFTGSAGTLRLDRNDPTLDPSTVLALSEESQLNYDDEGVDRVWAATKLTNLKGILVKRGTGALTLKATPSGAIVVGAGTVDVGKYHLTAGQALIGTSFATYRQVEMDDVIAPGAVFLYGIGTTPTNIIHGTINVAGTTYTVGTNLTGSVGSISFTGNAGSVVLNNTEPYTIGAISNVASTACNGNAVTLDWDKVDKTALGYLAFAGTNTLVSATNDPFATLKPVLAEKSRVELVVGDDLYIYRGEDAATGTSVWEKRVADPTAETSTTQVPNGSWSIVCTGALTPLILSEVWSVGKDGSNGLALASAGRDKVACGCGVLAASSDSDARVTTPTAWSAYRHHTYAVTFDATTLVLALWIDGEKAGATTVDAVPTSRKFSLNADGKCTIDSYAIYSGVITQDFIERDAAAHPVTPADEPLQTIRYVTGSQQGTDLTEYDANTDLVIVTNAYGYLLKKAVSIESEVRFVGDVAFLMDNGYSDTGTIFAYVSGSGDIVNGGKATTHTFYFQDGADFTGSILLTNQANRIAFAAKMDELDWPVGGVTNASGYFQDASRSQIYVAKGSAASLKDGGTWACNTRLAINGTLACLGAATLSCTGGVTIAGTLTYPVGYVRSDFYTGTNLTEIVVEPGVYEWSGAAGDGLWASSNNWNRLGRTTTHDCPIAMSRVTLPAIAENYTVELNEAIALASFTVSNTTDHAYRLVGSGAVGCTNAVTKLGPGDFALEGETIASPITVAEGSLSVDGSRLEQGVSLPWVEGAGQLYVTGGTVTFTNNLNVHVTVNQGATCVLTEDHNVRYTKNNFDGAGTLEFANALSYNGSGSAYSYIGMTGTVRLGTGCTFSCATGTKPLQFGTGILELGGATVYGSGGGGDRYPGVTNIVVLSGTENTIAEYTARMNASAALTGSGTLTFDVEKSTLKLSGDNRAFAGTLVSQGSGPWSNDPATIVRTATSAAATWSLEATGVYTNHVYTYLFTGDSSAAEPFAFGDLKLPSAATTLCFPEGAYVELGMLNQPLDLYGTVVSNAINLVINGTGESLWNAVDPLPAGSTITVKEGVIKLPSDSRDYTCGMSTMMFTDGTTDYYINTKDEPPKADFTVDGVNYPDGYLMMAAGMLKEGSVLTLNGDTGLTRTFAFGATGVTLDLGGHTVSNADNAVTWMLNVGTNALTLVNGTLDCGDGYGIFVTDGAINLSNVTIRAEGRCVQVAGAGSAIIDKSTRLETVGNDPTLMAVGGFDGRAYVEIGGELANTCDAVPDGESDWRYAVAGHAQDLAGVDFVFLKGAKLSATATDGVLYRPATESGTVTDGRSAAFTLPSEWLAQYNLSSTASADDVGANGLALAASYLLGLDPTNETSTADAEIGFDSDGNVVVTLRNVAAKADEYPDCIRFVLEDVNLENHLSVNRATTNSVLPFTVEKDDTKTRQFFRVKTLLSY